MFFTDNYWGSKSTDNSNKPKPPPSAQDIVAQIRAQGQQPSQQQIEAALEEMLSEQGNISPTMGMNGGPTPFDPLGSQMPSMADRIVQNKGVMPDWQDQLKQTPSAPNISNMLKGILSAGTEAARPKLGDMMGAPTKGILGAFGQVAQDVVGAANRPPESLEDMYRRLMQEYAPSYTGPSAEQMAQDEFSPQFQMLSQIAKQQKNRYDQNSPKIVDLYRALNDSAVKGRTDNAAMYDKTIAGQKAIQDESSKALQDRYAQALAAQSAQFKNLGIEDAAPTVFNDQAKTLNDNQAAQTGQSAIFENLNNSLKGNQYAYDTSNIGIQKQAGNQAQQDFLQGYLDQVANTDMQRLQLQGQQQQAENQYAQQISQMLSGASKDTGTFVNSMIGNILGQQQNQAQNEIDQARVMNSQDDLAFRMSQGSQQKLNPYDALQQNAVNVLKDPNAARQFSDILLEAYLRHPGAQNVAQLMEAVGEDTLKSNPAYTSLAFDFFSKMLASQK